MADGLAKVLTKPGFDPETFVNTLSQGGEDDLLDMRRQVQHLSDETSQSLKKNVYRNYSQFIETAREISILEGEMYQLSHMLMEQKNIMGMMMETSITSERVEQPKETKKEEKNTEEDTRKNLAFLLEKVEGCSSITEVPGRHLIHNGDLAELDPESFNQIQRVHAFLLNDSLMIAVWLPNRRGPVRYKFQALYELDSLAVVNARDAGPVRNAFKILMFPDVRMYQCDTAKAKRQWLDIIEETKKKKMASDVAKKEVVQTAERSSQSSFDAQSPFGDDDDAETNPFFMEVDWLKDDWLQDLPEDLDVCIAQRDFEGAVDLIEKGGTLFKIDFRTKQLTDVLTNELQVTPERSLRGGPRAARRAVTQLIRLGKSAQACKLFLKNRSAIIKFNLRQLKFEGATTLYIKTLCNVFFSTLMETGKEFIKAFPEHFACFSAFVVWAQEELHGLVEIFSRQIFASKMSLTTIADCVKLVREHCDSLNDIGLELTFNLNNVMMNDIQRTLVDSKDQLLEAVKHRADEDLWRPINLHNEDAAEKFVSELEEIGLGGMEKYIYNGCLIALTQNTVQFSRSYLSFLDDVLKLYTQELHHIIVECLTGIYKAQCKHMERSLNSHRFLREHDFIVKNAKFLARSLLPLVEKTFEESVGQPSKDVSGLYKEYKKLKRIWEESGALV